MAAFQPKFVDLVRNFSTTIGTGDFVLGAAMNGYSSFGSALQAGDQFYYSAIGIDKPIEREVGRGTMNANGTIARDPISGVKTNFTGGIKSLSLIAAAEWFNSIQAGGGSGSGGGTATAANRGALAALGSKQAPATLGEAGREGLFVFDTSNLSAKVAGDPNQGVYVAPSSDASGASGAWVRKYDGAVELRWFDVGVGTPNNAARVESAVELLGPGTYQLPKGEMQFERDCYIRREIILRGHGCSSRQVGTRCQFPAGCSGFRTAWDHADASGQDPFDTRFEDFSVYQPARNTNVASVSYNAATRTVTLPAAGDWKNGQVVWIEGAGYPHAMIGRTAAIASGSNVATIASLGGNQGVHVGQQVDIAGAGLPVGTTVTAWGPNPMQVTLSSNATATVSGAAINIKYPLVARIVSGGGTTSLVLDTVFQHYSVANAVMKHADSGILADRPIQIENVVSDGFPIGANLAGDSANVPTNGTNVSAIRYCRFASKLASLYMGGSDANASSVWGCDFSFSDCYGVLDLSLIGNYYFGCHFAFNIGVASPLNSSCSTLVASYFELGTSYVGGGMYTYAFGCTGFRNGTGWLYVGGSDDISRTGNFPNIVVKGTIQADEGYFSKTFMAGGAQMCRLENEFGTLPYGAAGPGLNSGRGAGYWILQTHNPSTSAYVPMRIWSSFVEIGSSGTRDVTFDASGINLEPGRGLKVNGTQVVGARQTGTPGDATDLGSAVTLVNALKAKLVAHGLIG